MRTARLPHWLSVERELLFLAWELKPEPLPESKSQPGHDPKMGTDVGTELQGLLKAHREQEGWGERPGTALGVGGTWMVKTRAGPQEGKLQNLP